MKQKLLALLMVSVMVASAFGAIAISATKVGAAGESLTLGSTSYSPAVGQQYTLSGLLTDGAGNPLANKPIDIYYHFVGGSWQFSNTIYTGADGKYSTTASSSQTVYLQTGYKVGGVYVASSNVVTINVQSTQPTLTLSSTSYSPSSGQQYTLSGYLRDSAGKALANKPIDIYYHFPGAGWQFSNTIYTGADGKYSTTASSSQTVYLQTGYKVGGVYVASSNVVTINVQEKATTTTISASNTNPAVNQIVTLTVTLNAGTTGLSKPIKLWYTKNGGPRIDRVGTFNTVNGVYTFSGPFGSAGTYVYHAEFAGDTTYAASSGAVTVNVGPATKLSLSAVSLGSLEAWLSGTLTDINGHALGKPETVKLYIGPSPSSLHWYQDVTTSDDGSYSTIGPFNGIPPDISITYYQAKFLGDSTYRPSTSDIVSAGPI